MASIKFGDEAMIGDNVRSGDVSHNIVTYQPFLSWSISSGTVTGLKVNDFLHCSLQTTFTKFALWALEACVKSPLAPGLRAGDTGADTVQPTRSVISV